MTTESEAPAGEANAKGGGGRRWSVAAILAVATSAIAVAAGGVGLLFKLDPAAEPCIGGASAKFVDAPVFPESLREYKFISGDKTHFVTPAASLGADVRATIEADNLRGNQVVLYYTLLAAGSGGASDRVVSGADEYLARTQPVSSCTWRGGFDVFVQPKLTQTNLNPTGLDPRKSYRIVLELFQGSKRSNDGGNRLALFETPVFRG